MRILLLAFFMVNIFSLYAQEGALVNSDFNFAEGIYWNFNEFKSNSPSITKFTVKNIGGSTYFEFPCEDSLGNIQTCTAENVWGYCKGKNVFINQGQGSLFFRLQIIGALIHYYVIETMYFEDNDFRYGNPYSTSYRRTSENEMIMEWETGNTFYFNYKSFSQYLSNNDSELYKELQNSKKKRKMIYFFLLKYNEKHLVYIENIGS